MGKVIYFIVKAQQNINLITMNTIQISNSAQKTQNGIERSMLSNFKSTNYLQCIAQKRSPSSKIRKDKSSIAAFYATPQKSSTIDINNKLSSKSLLQTNLPSIHPKHRSQKRSGFVQMWLDEALDPQDNHKKTGSNVEVEKTGPLKTVQKFQIDKKYLRSQNIDDELIEKLYNSLYVYTYGINNTFSQILALTKSNEYAEKKIVNNFWRAFAKLLQGCTSYQTAYQIIEKSQNKALSELKDTFIKKQEEFYQQKRQHQQQLAKLNRKINEQSSLILNLTNDFKISQATLNLTDEAFNEQVNLRLKFEQKINSVFISYQQIRGKYEKLLIDLKIKGDEFIQIGKMDVKLNSRIEEAMVYIQTLQKKLQRSEEIVRQRDLELTLSRQQIFQLKEKLNTAAQIKDADEEEVRKIISKMNLFKQKSEQIQCQFDIKHNKIKQLQQRIQQQVSVIDSCREANQKIYQKYQICEKEVGSFKVVKYELQTKIQQLQRGAIIMEGRINQVVTENNILLNQVAALQNQLKLSQDDLKLKINCIDKNSDIITNLRAIKDKSERLYQITAEEKRKIEQKLNQAVKISDVFNEEMKGMKMLLDNKATELQEVDSKLQNQRQVFKAKIAGLKEEISAKDSQILIMHDQQLQNQETVNKSKSEAERLTIENKQLTDEKLRLQAAILQLQTKLFDIQQQQKQHRQFLHQMSQNVECAQRSKIQIENTLNQKQFLLAKNKKQRNDQSNQLKLILESYRKDRERKISFIHPMIYQDCREQINRLTCNVQLLRKQKSFFQIQIEKCEKIIAEQRYKIGELDKKLEQANTIIVKELADKDNLKKTILQLQNQVSQGLIQRKKMEKIYKQGLTKNEQDMSGLRQKVKKVDTQNRSQQSTIKQLNQTIKGIQKQNNELHQKTKQFLNQLDLQKEEINKLQPEASIDRSQSKSIQRLSSKSRRITTKNKVRQSQENQQNIGMLSKTKLQSENAYKTQSKVQQGNMISQEVQTDKQKFSHASKFQTVNASYACQVNFTQREAKQLPNNNSNNSKSPPRQKQSKVQDNQFKRFLKITYMRR